jgi:hypothetical protein
MSGTTASPTGPLGSIFLLGKNRGVDSELLVSSVRREVAGSSGAMARCRDKLRFGENASEKKN